MKPPASVRQYGRGRICLLSLHTSAVHEAAARAGLQVWWVEVSCLVHIYHCVKNAAIIDLRFAGLYRLVDLRAVSDVEHTQTVAENVSRLSCFLTLAFCRPFPDSNRVSCLLLAVPAIRFFAFLSTP